MSSTGSITAAMQKGARAERPERPLRETPEPDHRRYRFVSVDDHLCEPPDLFKGRLPQKYADRAPRVERHDGADHWRYEDKLLPLQALDGMMSWDRERWDLADARFDEFRAGVYDIHERVRDMDIAGIDASLNFPSMVIGFAGQRFMRVRDLDFGLALMRAYNDWIIEEWAAPYPDRIIPCQVTWLPDPEIAAKEIRRNAERGFKAVAFTENPEKLGLPSIHKPDWLPFFEACEETQTVINLHIGSSSEMTVPSSDSKLQAIGALFPVNGLTATADWLFSQVPLKFPDIKVVISEGGIGFVPLLLDRLEHQDKEFQPEGLGFDKVWLDQEPEQILRRNFYFTSYYDPLSLVHRHRIGIHNIMLESDYPHADSTWPSSQTAIHEQIADFPKEDQDLLTHLNACRIYRHPVPDGSGVAESP